MMINISLKQAYAILKAAETRSRELGVASNIVVMDAGAHLKAFSRMDDALLGTIDIALRKARTAALFGKNTEAVGALCKPDGPFPGMETTNGGLVTFTGGVPVRAADGTVIGAVGVSGGDPVQDLDIAQTASLVVSL
jgi:uncharacterized protein GlcG (DUF336 family)